MFYKGWNKNNQQQNTLLEYEFERLRLIEEERRRAPKIQLKDFHNRMALKGILFSIAISWFLQMTGCYTITNYASLIFQKSGKTIFSANVSSIIIAIAQIFGGFVSTQLGDTFGRRTTLGRGTKIMEFHEQSPNYPHRYCECQTVVDLMGLTYIRWSAILPIKLTAVWPV